MSQAPELRVETARPGELEELVELLEEAGLWLWERGIRQWEPGSHRSQQPRLARDVEQGCVRLARVGADLAACVILDPERNSLWDDRPGDAGYVYKLAVARKFVGRGVGLEVLLDCERVTAARGAAAVRLDCWAGNARLRAYYEAAGYAFCGEAEEHRTFVALFEKNVAVR